MGDAVNHPSHYNIGSIEPIDAIYEWQLNFNLGNTVKYIARAGHKGDAIEDLEKARFYLDDEIRRRKAASAPVADIGCIVKCDDFPYSTTPAETQGEPVQTYTDEWLM